MVRVTFSGGQANTVMDKAGITIAKIGCNEKTMRDIAHSYNKELNDTYNLASDGAIKLNSWLEGGAELKETYDLKAHRARNSSEKVL